jgi:hypothetical protein
MIERDMTGLLLMIRLIYLLGVDCCFAANPNQPNALLKDFITMGVV